MRSFRGNWWNDDVVRLWKGRRPQQSGKNHFLHIPGFWTNPGMIPIS